MLPQESNMVGNGANDELYDISDSTDWLGTPLASLAPIENSLRCQVCKDFYKTPMITSCSHTFCSLCIRRCLSNDGKCPTCRATEQENKLRSNWAIETIVDDFVKGRPALLDISRKQPSIFEPRSPKRKAEQADPAFDRPDRARKKIRTSTRISGKPREREHVVLADSADSNDDEYVPEDGSAPCPVCGTRMKVEAIDSHLNRCLIEHSSLRSMHVSGSISADAMQPLPQNPPKKPDRLPQLNYSLFKDTTLRKKLQELGISSQGSRPLLEKRHTEWVTLWNANCDASRPRKKIDLLHGLDVWERSQSARVLSTNSGTNPASHILHKDFDGAGWAAKHDVSFQSLIASARKNLARATSQPAGVSNPGKDFAEKTEVTSQLKAPNIISTHTTGNPASSQQDSNSPML